MLAAPGTASADADALCDEDCNRAAAWLPTAATSEDIKQLSTNIAVPSISAGNSALYFLPERLLVREAKRYSDIDYGSLRVFH